MKRYARVRRHSMRRFPWRVVNRGDLAIFHIGRDAENHGNIWRLFQAHSGIAVLHDALLHELILHAPQPVSGRPVTYLDECERIHGPTGRLAASVFRGGLCPVERMAASFSLLQLVRESASGILVHDESLARGLAGKPGPPVVYVPHPLKQGGDPEQCVQAYLQFATSADSRYARSLLMSRRAADSIQAFPLPELREAVLNRTAEAIWSLAPKG